jgi:hypothetical protein
MIQNESTSAAGARKRAIRKRNNTRKAMQECFEDISVICLPMSHPDATKRPICVSEVTPDFAAKAQDLRRSVRDAAIVRRHIQGTTLSATSAHDILHLVLQAINSPGFCELSLPTIADQMREQRVRRIMESSETVLSCDMACFNDLKYPVPDMEDQLKGVHNRVLQDFSDEVLRQLGPAGCDLELVDRARKDLESKLHSWCGVARAQDKTLREGLLKETRELLRESAKSFAKKLALLSPIKDPDFDAAANRLLDDVYRLYSISMDKLIPCKQIQSQLKEAGAAISRDDLQASDDFKAAKREARLQQQNLRDQQSRDAAERRAAEAEAEALRLQKSRCDKLMKKIAEMGPVRALGLSLLSTDDEIQGAFKELSLEVHPDKNKAPNAKAAFQALLNAVDSAKLEIKRTRDATEADRARRDAARRDAARRDAEVDALLQIMANMNVGGNGRCDFNHQPPQGQPFCLAACPSSPPARGRCNGITLKGEQCKNTDRCSHNHSRYL